MPGCFQYTDKRILSLPRLPLTDMSALLSRAIYTSL